MSELQAYSSTFLDIEVDQSVLIVSLNRSEAMNALSPEMERDLHRVLDLAVLDDGIRCIVLTGTGKSFCTGYDLGGETQHLPDTATEMIGRWWKLDATLPDRIWHLMRLAKPVIAAVNGWCLGAGLWYSIAADITLASSRSVFGQPEVREGLDCSFLIAALAGWKNAYRYSLTGDHFDADEALRMGIVNEVVPHEELLGSAIGLAKRIALLPAESVRYNKALISGSLEVIGLRAALTAASAMSTIVHSSTDSSSLEELHRIREEEGMAASIRYRDSPFYPEPFGPRSDEGT